MRLIEVRYIVAGEGSYVDVVGIDVSKADFHACLLQGEKRASKSFPNRPLGYKQFARWLANRKCKQLHVCMEATGAYWEDLAASMHDRGATVSVVNPSRTAFFARSQLRRTKTDKTDAHMLAEFCLTQRPSPWTPPAREVRELRKLLDYRDHLVDERTRFRQIGKDVRFDTKLQRLHEVQLDTIAEMIDELETRIEEMISNQPNFKIAAEGLMAVRGFGLISAAACIVKLPVNRLRDAKAAAAYTGLTTKDKQSGTSVHGKPRLCKIGNASLRNDLFMPAQVAMRWNPILAAFAERLAKAGKPRRVIIVAVMRKLVVLAYRIIKEATEAQPIVA
jgi:transposase